MPKRKTEKQKTIDKLVRDAIRKAILRKKERNKLRRNPKSKLYTPGG